MYLHPVSAYLRAFTVLLLLCSSATAKKDDYLQEPPYSSPKLSPDGMSLAVVAKDVENIKALMIVDVADQKSEHYYPRDSKKKHASVISFAWVSKDTVIATSDAYKGAEVLYQVKVGDRVMRTLETEGKYSIVDPIPNSTRYLVAHRPENDDWGECTIEERDTEDLEYRNVLETFSSRVLECVTDTEHQPRVIKKNTSETGEAAWYWNNGSEWVQTKLPPWTRVHGMKYNEKNVAFIGGWMNESVPGLYFYNLETGTVESKLLDYPTYAIDRFAEPLLQGHPNVVLGYCLNVDVPRDVWLSRKLNDLQEFVDRQFKGTRNLIRDWDQDQEHLLIERVMMDSPSHLVWLEVKTQVSKLILINGGDIDLNEVGKSSVVQVKNRHGIDLIAMLTIPRLGEVKNLPLVVYIRPEPWDDIDRYGWCSEAEYLAVNGFVVLRMNMRGSAGTLGNYAADLKTVAGLTAFFEDIDDGITEILKTGIIDPNRIGIAGTGKGAWVAACAPVYCKNKIKAVVALNGVYDLLSYREKADEEDSVKRMMQFPFADPNSGLGNSELAKFSPMQNLDDYADALFIAYGKWSTRDFKAQSEEFMSEARRHNVTVRTFSDDWWGPSMKPEQRLRAWRDAAYLLNDYLKKE